MTLRCLQQHVVQLHYRYTINSFLQRKISNKIFLLRFNCWSTNECSSKLSTRYYAIVDRWPTLTAKWPYVIYLYTDLQGQHASCICRFMLCTYEVEIHEANVSIRSWWTLVYYCSTYLSINLLCLNYSDNQNRSNGLKSICCFNVLFMNLRLPRRMLYYYTSVFCLLFFFLVVVVKNSL